MVVADPLMTALGRPNREQVVTTRSSAATTLQSLELVNGGTLERMLRRGAERLAASHPQPTALVNSVFQRALGRAPTIAERTVCRRALGPAIAADGIEDLLWMVAMLPEFQLIH